MGEHGCVLMDTSRILCSVLFKEAVGFGLAACY